MTKRFWGYTILLLLGACVTGKRIIGKPIIFDESRKIMTMDYLKDRYGLTMNSPTIAPKMIVLHWTVLPTLEATFDAFEKSMLPIWRPELENASALNVSSQFLVDRDGIIYRLLPETTMARHVIGLNYCAIGIENVGGTNDLPLTEAQLKSNIWLIKQLDKKYDIDYLIGHYEYTNFVGNPLWLEKDENYRTEKSDPGEDFMQKVRNATKMLKFKPVPKKTNIQ